MPQLNIATKQEGDVLSHTEVNDIVININTRGDATTLSSHIENVSNPHNVTKTQIGLSNVDNTADASKPVSTAQQAALNLKSNLDTHSILTYGATTNIDFASTDNLHTLSLTGNVAFTTSNRTATKSRVIRILSDGSAHTFTFPAWKWIGSAAPTTIAANKTAILSLLSFGTADTDIVASYNIEA